MSVSAVQILPSKKTPGKKNDQIVGGGQATVTQGTANIGLLSINSA